MLPAFYHLIVFLFLAYSLTYNLLKVQDDPGSNVLTYRGYGGKFKFLTFWLFLLQTFYFGFSVVNDIFGSNIRPSQSKRFPRSRLQRWRDTLLSSIVFPVGLFVVCTFWGIYLVDRELVYPQKLDKFIPSWLNHVMHTTILPLLLGEMCLVYHHFPSRSRGLKILMSFALSYLIWILWVAYYADIWVYPILKIMAPHERVIFIAILMALFVSIYLVGEGLNKFLWGKERRSYQLMLQKSRS
ncbi:androgen-induced gene 1 protein-like [Mizuhopecten yessoensis]|uniref:androgen-induced gene 1 protein-like n=1 Tax=Mizuhopecten yessoensis TaxID=6573 RepID=UPI000B45C558|nr:androgen-induced gene 1 protein-like [Mizuhopecten yessoensis]